MRNLTRRSFITKTLLVLSSSVLSKSIFSGQLIESESLSNNPEFQHECYAVYQEWTKNELVSPMDFLINSINIYGSGKLKMSELTKIDFQNQNFFSIEGLLLGKTEAAFLALLGSNVNC